MATLKIIIIGSGIAGLTSARVLREKHDVTVFERGGPDAATGGQGIAAFPNAVKILDSLGFDRTRVGSVKGTGLRSYDKDGNLTKDLEINVKERYGADWLTHMRSDFRSELLRLATSPELPGKPARLVFNASITDMDTEKGLVTLGDGSTAKADLIIVADGVHSRLRHRISSDSTKGPQKMGITCFRVASPAKDAKNGLARLPEWWNATMSEGRLITLEAMDGSNRFITTYPLRNREYMNISCLFPTPEARINCETGSWHADGDRAEMLRMFSDFDPCLLRLLEVATEVKIWDLQDMDPLPTWTRGRAIAIGDAAHAMTPLNGQGANMAIEDADAMRLFLQSGVGPDDVFRILQQIDAVRGPRVVQVLQNSRAAKKEATLEKRFSVSMDSNFTYDGILQAMKKE